MPPKTRGIKISKVSKEDNVVINNKIKTKGTIKHAKMPRKALADRTNSASDDNPSVLQSKHSVKLGSLEQDSSLVKERPRRDRRLPNRYKGNNSLQNLSNRGNAENKIPKSSPIKGVSKEVKSSLKMPKINLDSSLVASRPKRICRLPSKFDDHSVSPSKFIPVQPAYASTPKLLSNTSKQIEMKKSNNNVNSKQPLSTKKVISSKGNKKKLVKKKNIDTTNTQSPNSSADTNNNAKKNHLPHNKTKNSQNISPKVSVPYTKPTVSKKLADKDYSIKILDDKKKSLKRDASKLDVYEFTYDPNEEPPPQKRKRRKPVKKREAKPKTFFYKSNYEKNLAKALAALKNTVSGKSAKPVVKATDPIIMVKQSCTAQPIVDTGGSTVNTHSVPRNSTSATCNLDKSHVSIKNYNSVRVEDIALDFEDNCVDDVNYSPVHSPCAPTTTDTQNDVLSSVAPAINNEQLNSSALERNKIVSNRTSSNNDPLNLRDDLSFFDDQPVASSSMNVSIRNPEASPWRVEFGSLPIKWQVNTYVKPNMTPAFESSFINFNENKKKHVYTNIVTETNDENDLPQIYDDKGSKLKQTSIISFIKEVVERNTKKKRDKMTPIKANTLFEDISNATVSKTPNLVQKDYVTPEKNLQSNDHSDDQVTPPNHDVSAISEENRNETDNSEEKENTNQHNKGSSKRKKRDKDVTYFGFDDTDQDQENVSPSRRIHKRRLHALKPHSRAVLQEINGQKGPTRAILPISVTSRPIQTVNTLFDQMKSANEPPVFPEKAAVQSTETTNITEVQTNEDSNDDQSVHLFEDVEVVHHLKTHRKSYGKAKKAVTFRQNSISDSDVPPSDVAEQSSSSDGEDLHDLTFKIPEIEPKKSVRKKKSKQPKLSKKEQQEAEAWAAGFNSMCEDIEEFDLVVE